MADAPPDIPAGFAPHWRKSGLTDPWQPLYSRRTEDAVYIGLRAGPAHSNSRGFVHGGLISALADNAMGLSCDLALGHVRLVTVNLTLDFIAAAKQGEWLEVRPESRAHRLDALLCHGGNLFRRNALRPRQRDLPHCMTDLRCHRG